MNLIAFFDGGVGYTELRDMPMPELSQLHREAERAARKKKAQ